MKKLVISLISAAMFTVGAGVMSTADANGTVKKGTAHRHHHKHHHPHKRHYHKPHCPVPCAPVCPPCLYHTGVYAGGLIGWSHMNTRIKDLFFTNDTVLLSSKLTRKRHNDSFIGELLVGGRYIFESMCDYPTTVGLEVSGTWDDHKVTSRLSHFGGPDSQIKFKRQYAVIPTLVFGKVFCCNWHAFFKIGLGISRFKTRWVNLEDVPLLPRTKKKTQVGVVPALGLEYAVNPCISVVGTAAYEWYTNANTTFRDTVIPPTGTFTENQIKARPRFFNLKAGILVKI